MNIAICDDLQSDSQLLSKYIEAYCAKFRLDLKLSVFVSGEAILENFQKDKYDILFLDIYMGEKSGMETAHAIRETGSECMIIFTTTSLDHAIESFEVQATHYLVKPLSYEHVEKALDRCKQLFTLANRYIEVRSERILVRVLLNELMFAEVYSNMAVLHTTSGEVKAYISLDELELLLDGEEFLRCHRSYIINMNFITGTENTDFILENGQRIPIRRQDKLLIKQRHADYLFNTIRGYSDV